MSERLSKTEAMMSYDIRLLPISQIKIGLRHRKDVGDLAALAASIEKGLLQPIGVTPRMELIWGLRRLMACRDILGWETIPARVVSVASIAQGEFDENVMRKDYTPSERVALIETLRGFGHGGDRKSDQSRSCDFDRLTTSEAAGRVGFCRDDYFRAKQVVEAAKEDPERFAHLVERMDRTGRIAGAYRELKICQEAEKIRQEPQPLPQGPFRVAVVDPPWKFEDESYSLSRTNVTPYPVMTVEEIMALPIPSIMHEDSVIWLWTTNRHLAGGEAGQILKYWGFRPLSLLTWVKDRPGTGVWLRGQTEHVILSVRGKPVPPQLPESTLLQAPRTGTHSSKPDEFYALVERLCPGCKVEIFARKLRQGWTTWGSELWGESDKRGDTPVRRPGTRPSPPLEARPETGV
jgi:N6-adenosine-specific RNA methylase IME4